MFISFACTCCRRFDPSICRPPFIYLVFKPPTNFIFFRQYYPKKYGINTEKDSLRENTSSFLEDYKTMLHAFL